MDFALEVLIVTVVLSAAMGVAWLVAERTGRSGWIDAIWTFATGLAGITLALLPASPGALRPILVAGLAALWSLRLGLHIAWRTARGGDDPRYRQLRVEWGDKASGRLFGFFKRRLRRVLFSLSQSRRRPIGLGTVWTSATRWASRSLRLLPLEKERPIGNWPGSACMVKIKAKSVTPVSGAIRAIRTIFSSGWSGWRLRSSPSNPAALILGAGLALPRLL